MGFNMETSRLTDKEVAERNSFIAMCVDENRKLPDVTTFGVPRTVTIQDLCNSNIETLLDIGAKLSKEAQIKDFTFARTRQKDRVLVLNGVKADDWLTFLKLTIQKKEYDEEIVDRNKKKEALKKIVDKYTSADVKLANALADLAALDDNQEKKEVVPTEQVPQNG